MATPTFNLPTSGSDPKRATKEGLEENINSIIQYLDNARISGDASLMAGLEFQGGWDASTGLFPDQDKDGNPLTKGDFFWVAVEGTFGGETYSVNEPLVATVDNPSTSDVSDWYHAPLNPSLVPILSRINDMAVPFDTVSDFFSATLADIKTLANATTGTAYVSVKNGGYSYTVDLDQVLVGDLVWQTDGGVWITPLPNVSGDYNFAMMNPAADGVTDDYPRLHALLNVGFSTWRQPAYPSGPSIFLPNNPYFMSQTIELKAVTKIRGNHSGQPQDNPATLIFPADTGGITVNRLATIDGGLEDPKTGAADGSLIEGIALQGGGGTDKLAHGIWLRARAVLRNISIDGFAGTGIRPYANSSGGADSFGNCNNFVIDTARVTYCEHGLWAEGIDANAGVIYNLDCSLNRRWGIWDGSFLGNYFYGAHTSSNGGGSDPDGSAFAKVGSQAYHAVPSATEEEWRTTEPGTDPSVWRECGNVGDADEWTGTAPVGFYRSGGGYYSDNANSRGAFTDCYSEGSQGLTWGAQHYRISGAFNASPIATGAQIDASFNMVRTNRGFWARENIADGTNMDVRLGGNGENGDALYISPEDDEGDPIMGIWRLRHLRGTDKLIFDNNNQGTRRAFSITGPSSDIPYAFETPIISFGTGNGIRRFMRATSTAGGVVFPTSGEFTRGDSALAVNPTSTGNMGWVCVTSGTAGSTAVFKEWGAIV